MPSSYNDGTRDETPSLPERTCWQILVQPTAFSEESNAALIRQGWSYYRSAENLDEEQLSREVSSFALEALNLPRVDSAETATPSAKSNPCRLALVAGLAAVLVQRQESFRRDPRTCIVPTHIHSQLKQYIVAASREAVHNRVIRMEMGRTAFLLPEYQDPETAPVDQPLELASREDDRGRGGVYFKLHKNAVRAGCHLPGQDESRLPVTTSTEDYVYVREPDVERIYTNYWEDPQGRAPGNRLESATETVFSDRQLDNMGQALSKIRTEIESLVHHGLDDRLFHPLSVPPEVKLLIMVVDFDPTLSFGTPLSPGHIAKATTRYRQHTEQIWPENHAGAYGSAAEAQGRLQQLADDDDCLQVESATNPNFKSARYIVKEDPSVRF